MGTFSPVMRSHEGNRPDENWQFDSDVDTLTHIAGLTNVHKALKPYLIHADRQKAEQGIPMIRPLFFYYDEPFTFEVDDMYLLGRDLLVAPVLNPGCDHMSIILPKDQWIHLWTGTLHGGGWVEVDVPYGKPPVFYRKDSEFAHVFSSIMEM